MSSNIELKTYCTDLNEAKLICTELGGNTAGEWTQSDTYFETKSGRLKIRETSGEAPCLIAYNRTDEAAARESKYSLLNLKVEQCSELKNILSNVLGVSAQVTKNRTRYEVPGALINLDFLPNIGAFLEIEVFANDRNVSSAKKLMLNLKTFFKISDSKVIPWSYSQLVHMYSKSNKAKKLIEKSNSSARLYLIDGCSGSGKTTVIEKLMSLSLPNFVFAKRHSTRLPRGVDDTEYEFITRTEFDEQKNDGLFIDCKDFLFGMSYGLSWNSVLPNLLNGINVIAPMNWGNAVHVRHLFPDALLICLDVNENTIKKRLLARGAHNIDEIEERLGNARRFVQESKFYDLKVSNEEGNLDQCISHIVNFIK